MQAIVHQASENFEEAQHQNHHCNKTTEHSNVIITDFQCLPESD